MVQQDTNIRISVVIPVYNGSATVCRAIASAMGQTCAPYEVIVVDDASTDDTVQVIEAQWKGDVILIQKENNAGSSAARNAGMDKASGSHIAFLDADDEWHRDKLRIAAAALTAQPDIALLYHPFTMRDIHADVLPDKPEVISRTFVQLLPGNRIAPSCTVIVNDAAFRFDPAMRHTEDYELWLRVAYGNRVAYMPYALTRIFRMFTSGGGISSARWKMRKGELVAYTRLVRLNPLFVCIVPALWIWSLMRHVMKMAGIKGLVKQE